MNIAVYCIIAFILYCLQFPFIIWGLKKLRCTRAFSRTSFFAGESGELIEVVRNDGFGLFPWLRLESQISRHLQLGSQQNLQVSHSMYYSSLFILMPHQQIRRTHRVKFLRRGIYDLGNAHLTVGDILDLFRFSHPQDLDTRVMVYPALLDTEQLPTLLSQKLGELSQRRQLQQDPFLIRGIRPYLPGDPVRNIHWPATARTGEAHVRIHDYTARTKLLVILNVQAQYMQWQNRLPEQMEDAMEYAISLAATLCMQSLQMGLAAGFCANACLQEEDSPVLLLPAEGNSQTESLLSAFARLQTHRAQPFATFLEKLKIYSGLDIFILSHYNDEEIRAASALLEQNGNQVTFHLLEGGNTCT